MKSFSVSRFIIVILIAACTFISCKKDKEATPGSIMQGSWEGLYGLGNAEPTEYFELVIKSNGTLEVKSGKKDNPDIIPGTWTLEEDIFKALYKQNGDDTYLNLAAKLDDAKKKLTGSWGYGKENPGIGDFEVTKK